MHNADGCGQWQRLAAEARAQAKKDLPDADAEEQIRQTLARARESLKCDDVQAHCVPFDPGMWDLHVISLPQHALDRGCISRGDAFALASEPADADTNWQLFCTSFVFGYGRYGVGPTRLQRILMRTPREKLCPIIAETLELLRKCGPLRAYDYLWGDGRNSRVPCWGPAFFTKLLYFADAPGQSESALILDNQTAWMIAQLTSMEHLLLPGNRSERWTPYRYWVYLAWMTLMSERLLVRPDFLEYALFLEAKRRRRR